MRLFYHPESDSLFWSGEWPSDGLCEDVTDEVKLRRAARDRGIKEPPMITVSAVEKAAAQTIRGCGTICKDEPQRVAFYKELPADSTPLQVAQAFAGVRSGGLAGAIQTSYKKWDRKPADFYPTPFDVTHSLLPLVQTLADSVILDERPFRIWEPCCGDLDMTRVLQHAGYEVTSTDIRDTGVIPFGEGFGGFDFLNDDPVEKFGWEPQPDMIVMNPPFNLAAEFIERALRYTPNVACLMKIDYWNAVSRLPLWQRNIPQFFLPLTWRPAFLKAERGNSPLMNCAWCVWTEHRDTPDMCVIEPMRKLVYPGYQGPGLRTAMSRLVQAIDDLTEVTSRVSTNA